MRLIVPGLMALCMAGVLAAAPAQAETLDFTGGGNHDLPDNLVYTTTNGDWYQNANTSNGGTDPYFDLTDGNRLTVSAINDLHIVYGDTQPDNGGLGIDTDANNANAGSNDNIASGEGICLDFDDGVIMGDVTFWGPEHQVVNGTIEVNIGGGGWEEITIVNGVHNFKSYGVNTSFKFRYDDNDEVDDNHNPSVFYISVVTVVPEPGSLSLLAAGLAGVAAMRRRRRKA